MSNSRRKPFRVRTPVSFRATFSVEKSTFDLFLTQYARTLRGFDRERYIREYARLGFTHIEVNALAAPFPYEQGVPGEFYPDFYTYCPALDQFVESRLNRGLYPREYLEANLARLKENARLAVKYGLMPGLLCFEPRSVPETLFQKYPTLRGARVDHPFRSFKPRYTLSLVHPLAQKHYAELMANLMAEVPELEFMSVWSNDSGSGFEHTKSLYVGRNGGAYMIREWKNDEEIARAAAANIASFYRILRDAARTVNPQFRVITRLESFYGERRHLWPLLRDGIDVEVNSLLVAGWENNYPHPSYPDIQVLGSAYHNHLRAKEKRVAAELGARGGRSYFYHFFNSHGNHEPLLGIPFPWLTYEKLAVGREAGHPTLAHMGGLQPPDKVPFAVNQEVFREFQLDAGARHRRDGREDRPRLRRRPFRRRPGRAAGGWSSGPSGISCRCPCIRDSARSGTGFSSGRSSPTSAGSRTRSAPTMKRSWSAPSTTRTRWTWPGTSCSSSSRRIMPAAPIAGSTAGP